MGKGWIQIEDEEIKIRPGDVFALPRNTPHSYGADEKNPWSIYWFHLLGNNCDEISKSITGGKRVATIRCKSALPKSVIISSNKLPPLF